MISQCIKVSDRVDSKTEDSKIDDRSLDMCAFQASFVSHTYDLDNLFTEIKKYSDLDLEYLWSENISALTDKYGYEVVSAALKGGSKDSKFLEINNKIQSGLNIIVDKINTDRGLPDDLKKSYRVIFTMMR